MATENYEDDKDMCLTKPTAFVKTVLAGVALSVALLGHAGVEPMMSATIAWDGSRFEYPACEVKVTAVKLVLNEGDVSPYHCH